MSSGPATSPTGRHIEAGRRRGPAGWSLRARLMLVLAGLVVAVCAIIGVVTTVAVYRYGVGRLDDRLQMAMGRTGISLGSPGADRLPRPKDGKPPPQDVGTIATIPDAYDNHTLEINDQTTGWTVLTAEQARAVESVPMDDRPHSIDVPGIGAYRVIAKETPEGDPIYTGLSLTETIATRNALIGLEVSVGLGAAILAAMLGALLVRSNLRPLRRVAATAGRVAELPLDRGEVALSVRVPDVDTDPRTEVGQVGAALNRMLGHVADALAARQASETRIRHFVADASHELRTPLAAIRGYAELTRRLSADVPPDVVHAMSRVESETARMTALVEDLLLLARLDSGRPLERAPVDLSRLVIDAVSDAHVAAPEHRWRLNLPEESVTVTGDELRLHQVLGNLLANARTHTPPGTTVTISIRVTGPGPVAAAALVVEDNGPGIPPELLPDVFERFARGDTSRSRAAGSTGLGLSIVAAVVEAHHGSVEVASRPGHTVFTVRLPLAVDSPPHQPPVSAGDLSRST